MTWHNLYSSENGVKMQKKTMIMARMTRELLERIPTFLLGVRATGRIWPCAAR